MDYQIVKSDVKSIVVNYIFLTIEAWFFFSRSKSAILDHDTYKHILELPNNETPLFHTSLAILTKCNLQDLYDCLFLIYGGKDFGVIFHEL